MRKIPTLFQRDPDDMRRVTNTVHPDATWVLDGEGQATRKYDGTCLMLDDDGRWWARREVKPGKSAPDGWVEVDHDTTTGKRVGWEPVEQSSFVKFWSEAVAVTYPGEQRPAGTYELIGPKVNGNPEGVNAHELIRHAAAEKLHGVPRDIDGLRSWLEEFTGEGIVWHHPDGRMAKLKRRDFQPAGVVEREG